MYLFALLNSKVAISVTIQRLRYNYIDHATGQLFDSSKKEHHPRDASHDFSQECQVSYIIIQGAQEIPP